MRTQKGLFDGAKPVQRLGYVFVGLMVIGTGILSLLEGRTHYGNFWNEVGFAPFAIVVGLLLVVAVVVAWARKK